MNYGFSDGNLGAKAPWDRNRGALKPPTVLQQQAQKAVVAAVYAEKTAVTPEQIQQAAILRAKSEEAFAVAKAGVSADSVAADYETRLKNLAKGVDDRLKILYNQTIALVSRKGVGKGWAAEIMADYTRKANQINAEYDLEAKKLEAEGLAKVNEQMEALAARLYEKGINDARAGMPSPAVQADADRQTIYNAGFDSFKVAEEADKTMAAEEAKRLALLEQAQAKAAADEVARIAAEQAAEQSRQAAEQARVAQLPQEASPSYSPAALPVASLAPAAPIASVVVSDASMPSPTVSNPVSVLKRISLPPLTPSFPSALPAASSPSQAVFQASIGGADLKTVAMIAIPLLVLGLILRR